MCFEYLHIKMLILRKILIQQVLVDFCKCDRVEKNQIKLKDRKED